jgi:hypothetical protein
MNYIYICMYVRIYKGFESQKKFSKPRSVSEISWKKQCIQGIKSDR